MKYCPNCSTSNADSSKFCIECGTPLSTEDNSFDTSYTYEEVVTEAEPVDTTEVVTYSTTDNSDSTEDKYTYTYNANNDTKTEYSSAYPGIIPRNIVVAIILSFVTCGIFQIYWMIKLNDEVNILSNESDAPSGIIVFLLTLVTCGIYGFFWMYKMGERCDRIKGSVGGSSGILYLILSILGLGIVSYCLMQDTLNKAL